MRYRYTAQVPIGLMLVRQSKWFVIVSFVVICIPSLGLRMKAIAQILLFQLGDRTFHQRRVTTIKIQR